MKYIFDFHGFQSICVYLHKYLHCVIYCILTRCLENFEARPPTQCERNLWVGCGPVVKLLACRARPYHSIPYWKESGVPNELMWRRPSGHGINYTSVLQRHGEWSECNSHTVEEDGHTDVMCIGVGQASNIICLLCPPTSDGYLVEQES